MKKIVLISGKQGSGKTTAQELIKTRTQQKGQSVAILNFADVLYEMHNAVLEILNRYWPPRDIVKDGPLLQLLGTEWGRKTIDENIWVKVMKTKVEKTSANLIIVGDCRFENEFDAFPEALRVRLECPSEVRKKRCSMWRENETHPSEVGLDNYSEKFDLKINTDTLGVDGVVSLICAQLDKNVWLEKRGTK